MSGVARVWYAVTALVVVVALWIQIPITAADAEGAFFTTPAGRVANLFTFFTILTNLIVAVTGVWLAVAPASSAFLLRVLRLDALLGIMVTGAVYWTLLAHLNSYVGAEWVANQLFHTVSPLLVVAGWLLFGPRRLVDGRVVVVAVAYPVAWLAFTLVRGAMIGWYPYPFIDVIDLGYARALLNCLGITVLFAALAVAVWQVDRLLSRRTPATVVEPAP